MDDDTATFDDNKPLLPPHTKQAARAMALLLFYSVLMFTLPFGAFFATKYILQDNFGIDGYNNTVASVLAAVITVNLIIAAYAYQAYHETEYDDEGNELKPQEPSTSKLNLKQD